MTAHALRLLAIVYLAFGILVQIWDGVSNRCVNTFKEAHTKENVSTRVLASNPGLPRPDFSPRLRDKIWARKAWVRGYTCTVQQLP